MAYVVDEDDDNDNDNDDYNNDDKDDYSSNSVSFQARTTRFCMKVCLDNSYNMMIMKMTIIMMMMIILIMKTIIAVSWSIFKLGSPDFAWK